MSLGHLTSSLRVLNTLKNSTSEHSERLLGLISARLVHDGDSQIVQKKTKLQLVLLSCAVCGIEFCYAAETAFVSPILLQIGVHVIYMSLIWCLSPMLGLFLVPILGSVSDRCTWKLGRRRPFILILSITIVLGLLLVPNGQDIGIALGDVYVDPPHHDVTSYNNITNYNNITSYNNTKGGGWGVYENTPHPWSILFTVLGVVMLDFSCDACQSPCRAYLLDVSIPEDHPPGLTTFTVMAGLGGSLGYVMGGINWENTKFGESLGGHVRVVFTLVLIIYIVCLFLTITSVKEVPLKKIEAMKEDDETKMNGSTYRQFVNNDSSQKPIGRDLIQSQDYGTTHVTEQDYVNPHNPFKKDRPITTPVPACTTHPDQLTIPELSVSSPPAEMSPIHLPSEISLRTYLVSIVRMPRSLLILCITNLWCWMSLVCYSLYFTDFVGQAVFGGDPMAAPDSKEHDLYEEGVRMGSFAMSLYSLSCSVYSLCIEKLVSKLGARPVYIGSQLVYTIGAAMMAVTKHKITVVLLSPCAGIMYATLFTMPYLLVAHYHDTKTFDNSNEEEESSREQAEKQIRGLGTDIALVSSMVFIAQFILSAAMGSIVHAMGSTVAVPICASVLSFLGAITATQVLYLGL